MILRGRSDVNPGTGGAGFIGSNLVKALLAEGRRVRALDNLLSGHASNLSPFPDVEVCA